MKESLEEGSELPLALRAAYLGLHRTTDATLAQHGVTADQYVLLLALADNRTLTQRELANRISSDPSTVRAMLVLLEKNGFVHRACHPTDSRAKSMSLTSAGKRKIRKTWKAAQSIRNKIYETMTTAEADTLLLLLRKVSNAFSHEKSDF